MHLINMQKRVSHTENLLKRFETNKDLYNPLLDCFALRVLIN